MRTFPRLGDGPGSHATDAAPGNYADRHRVPTGDQAGDAHVLLADGPGGDLTLLATRR